jgi:hypothetical protein
MCIENTSRIVWFEVPKALTMRSAVFWNVTPCSRVEVYRRFRWTSCLHLWGRSISQVYVLVVAWLAYSSILMEVVRSSETSMNLCRTTQCPIPGDGNLHQDMLWGVTSQNVMEWIIVFWVLSPWVVCKRWSVGKCEYYAVYWNEIKQWSYWYITILFKY